MLPVLQNHNSNKICIIVVALLIYLRGGGDISQTVRNAVIVTPAQLEYLMNSPVPGLLMFYGGARAGYKHVTRHVT